MTIRTVIANCTVLCQNKEDPEPEHFCTVVRADNGKQYLTEHETGMEKGDVIHVIDTLLFWKRGDKYLNIIQGQEPPPTLGEMVIV